MRISTSLVISFALYLGLATAAIIPNAVDITSRDDVPTGSGVADTLTGSTGTIVGTIGGAVLPQNTLDNGIKQVGGKPPGNTDDTGAKADPTGNGIADGLTGNFGKIFAGTLQSVLPENTNDNAIKAVGGSPPGGGN